MRYHKAAAPVEQGGGWDDEPVTDSAGSLAFQGAFVLFNGFDAYVRSAIENADRPHSTSPATTSETDGRVSHGLSGDIPSVSVTLTLRSRRFSEIWTFCWSTRWANNLCSSRTPAPRITSRARSPSLDGGATCLPKDRFHFSTRRHATGPLITSRRDLGSGDDWTAHPALTLTCAGQWVSRCQGSVTFASAFGGLDSQRHLGIVGVER